MGDVVRRHRYGDGSLIQGVGEPVYVLLELAERVIEGADVVDGSNRAVRCTSGTKPCVRGGGAGRRSRERRGAWIEVGQLNMFLADADVRGIGVSRDINVGLGGGGTSGDESRVTSDKRVGPQLTGDVRSCSYHDMSDKRLISRGFRLLWG